MWRAFLRPRVPGLLAALRSWAPPPLASSRGEFVVASFGATLGLLATQALAHRWLGTLDAWFIAPMGAAAVLLFALPASPLAQPWPVLVGNTLAAIVGVACFNWLGATPVAAAAAGGGAIAAMFLLRCLHPPAGAVAVTAVLGGPAVHHLGYAFATQLVPLNAALLLVCAIALNRLAGRRYPHAAAPRAHATADPPPTERLVTRADLQAALATHGERLDVDVEDLEAIFSRAQLHAGERRWGAVRCRDVMSRDLVTVQATTPVSQAWSLLMRHDIEALPVVSAGNRLVGIVSLHHFVVAAAENLPQAREAAQVQQIMTREVRVARAQQPIAEIVAAFSDGGLHHLPVVGSDDRLLGMITQSDLVAALFLVQPAMAQASGEAPLRRGVPRARPA